MRKSRLIMEIGQKVKKIRELRNFTQDYVASQLGITQESYHKIEVNKTNVSTQRLEQLAKILEVSIFDLMSFDENKVLFNFSDNDQKNAQIGYFGVEAIKELYEKIIQQQKEEIAFLRSCLKEKL
jgi:transcriptional regulator with XRE-family HTH domain